MNCPCPHGWIQIDPDTACSQCVREEAQRWICDCTELVRELGGCVHESAVLVEHLIGQRVHVCVQCGARRMGDDTWIDAEYTRRARELCRRVQSWRP